MDAVFYNKIPIFGLLLGFVAAVLMYYFPARVTQYTEKGEEQVTLVNNPTTKGKRRGHIQRSCSKVAPWLLAFAFLLQLPSQLLPVLQAAPYATDNDSGYGTLIAIEVRQHGQFNGVVGKLEYTARTIDIVTFHLSKSVTVLPQVCELLEKTTTNKGIHSLKCRNQYGATFQGTIDFRDRANPTVILIGEGGTVYTNISKEAREMKQMYIPNIELGF